MEDGRIDIEGISATSAGAMNATVLAYGFAEGGREGARKALADFWRRIANAASASPLQPSLLDRMTQNHGLDFSPAFQTFDLLARVFSPYQFNPMNFNPLRHIVEQSVDFERLRKTSAIKLFLNATNVRTGKVRLFRNAEITPDAVMASACLPLHVPGGGDRRRGLLGRRLHGQSRHLPADLRVRNRPTSSWSTSTRSRAPRCRERRPRSSTASTRSPSIPR